MVGEVLTGLAAFKSMFDIAKAMKDMDDAVKRNAAVYDLWEKITAVQEQYTAAIEQVDTLKAELARFETWETEKEKYELKGTGTRWLRNDTEANGARHRNPTLALSKLLRTAQEIVSHGPCWQHVHLHNVQDCLQVSWPATLVELNIGKRAANPSCVCEDSFSSP